MKCPFVTVGCGCDNKVNDDMSGKPVAAKKCALRRQW